MQRTATERVGALKVVAGLESERIWYLSVNRYGAESSPFCAG